MRNRWAHLLLVLTGLPQWAVLNAGAQTLREEIAAQLTRPIIASDTPLREVQAFTSSRIVEVPEFRDVATWEQAAATWRADTLDKIVFRGDIAKTWRDAETQVHWVETVGGGPGYHIKKLIYEALPGLWIPALLYEPDHLVGQVPVALNVNGHDALGKATDFKQIRCINQAKRGMLALSTEWLGFGQLQSDGFHHDATTQLDLCGASGLAPYYLSLSRALDILLDHPNADPQRVAVTGLSGGGWQTILISALDTRVTLSNPVAGYSSLKTRTVELRDLGDPEQTPNDMATIVDYTHLTAMMAPRPTLLTYNVEDRCCFAPASTLPPLLAAAEPIYALYDQQFNLRQHIHSEPRTHTYSQDNREAHYAFLGDHFFRDDATYVRAEIESSAEVKTVEELTVPVPADNVDFSQLAATIATQLPRPQFLPPPGGPALEQWQTSARTRLADLVRYTQYKVAPEKTGENSGAIEARFWRLSLDGEWSVPVAEFIPADGGSAGTTIVVSDDGRSTLGAAVEELLESRHRVLAVDPFYFGESAITTDSVVRKDWLFALMVAAVGERPIGVQASQVAAIARWASSAFNTASIEVQAFGKGASLCSLIAACLEPAIGDARLHDSLASLKDVLTANETAATAPEQFCFGLLEQFDVAQLWQLAASTSAPARAPVIDWPAPESIVFGTPLDSTQLNATSDTPGSFVYTPSAGIVLDAGEHQLTVHFSPLDAAQATEATAEVSLTVEKATPSLSWESPEHIVFGEPLSPAQLDAAADVPGILTYTPPLETILSAGTHTLSVRLTPTNADNFSEAELAVDIVVDRRTPSIAWPPPAAITFGDPLDRTQLNAMADVEGLFSYAPPADTLLSAGEHKISVTFIAADAANFKTATTSVALTVRQKLPEVIWEAPLEIPFGTVIGLDEIPFAADVGGRFAFDPIAGTILPIGSHTLTVTFTPADRLNYGSATVRATLTVIEKPGDLNGDGSLDELDIDDFIEALLSAEAYALRTGRDPLLADLNDDGALNSQDLKDFIQLLQHTGNLTGAQQLRLLELPALRTPGADDDGDGSSNGEELVAGTSPYDASDWFRITRAICNDASCSIEWTSVPGKLYIIERSEMLSAPWEALQDAAIEATGPRFRVDLPLLASPQPGYYRVRLIRR